MSAKIFKVFLLELLLKLPNFGLNIAFCGRDIKLQVAVTGIINGLDKLVYFIYFTSKA